MIILTRKAKTANGMNRQACFDGEWLDLMPCIGDDFRFCKAGEGRAYRVVSREEQDWRTVAFEPPFWTAADV